jgi:hypothetical protein
MALKDLRVSVRGTLRLRQWCRLQHSKQTCRQSLAVEDARKRQFALILRSRSVALRSLGLTVKHATMCDIPETVAKPAIMVISPKD